MSTLYTHRRCNTTRRTSSFACHPRNRWTIKVDGAQFWCGKVWSPFYKARAINHRGDSQTTVVSSLVWTFSLTNVEGFVTRGLFEREEGSRSRSKPNESDENMSQASHSRTCWGGIKKNGSSHRVLLLSLLSPTQLHPMTSLFLCRRRCCAPFLFYFFPYVSSNTQQQQQRHQQRKERMDWWWRQPLCTDAQTPPYITYNTHRLSSTGFSAGASNFLEPQRSSTNIHQHNR